MDLAWTAEQLSFRDALRGWLERNVPREDLPALSSPDGVAAHREWERRLQSAGYAALHWPRDFGGGGADDVIQFIFTEEYLLTNAPQRLNRMGLGLIGPTLIQLGTTEQKSRWLPRILSCDELWCQGFSEPEAGSDLASVRTRAVLDGDHLVINGQKTWTSLAVFADWMFALVRTGSPESRHRGLTFVLLPMDAEGVEVRPMRQLHGEPGFAEVFLTDVTVPLDNVVGRIGDGWSVAMATLGYERGSGLTHPVRFTRDVTDLVHIARRAGLANDPVVRDTVAARFVEAEVYRWYMQHVLTTTVAGHPPPLSSSISKLYWSEMESRIFESVLESLGPSAELTEEAPGFLAGADFHRRYWHARAARIFAGTNEVQRNLIAQRALGLPKDRG
jgi:alkylation response protein AidB-like acyl-CoA dehydrogenase